MAVTLFLTSGIDNVYLSLIAKIFIAAALYVLMMWAAGSDMLKEAVRFFRHKEI